MKVFRNIRLYLLASMLTLFIVQSVASNHYSRAIAIVHNTQSGRGIVYVEAPSDGNNGSKSDISSTADKTEYSTGNPTHEYSFQVASTTAGYEFDGWYATETGGDKITEGLKGTTLSVSITASSTKESEPTTVTRYARWNPKKYTITLDDQSASNHATATQSITAKYNSSTYSAISVLPTRTDSLFDGYFTGRNGSGVKVISKTGVVLSNAGSYTDGDAKWKYDFDGSFTLYADWVGKYTPQVTCAQTTLSVDEELSSAFTFTNTSGITWEYVGKSINAINNGDGYVVVYDDVNNKLIAHNAGTVTIRFTQASTSEINAGVIDINITVNKISNTIACSWGSWSKDVNFDTKTPVKFSSDNDAYAPIVVTQILGKDTATYKAAVSSANPDTLIANYHAGPAVWQVSQVEDYKYQAATNKNCTITVGTISSPGCDVLNEPDPKTIGDSYYELTWNDENAAGTLYFQNYCQTNHTGGVNVDQYINVDGVWQWVRVYQIVYDDTKWHDYGNYSTPLNQGAKGVRFSRYGTYKRYFQNVRVSRAKRFDIEDADGNAITEIDMPSKTASGAATTATFYVDYSTCDDEIKVVSDHPRITVSDASFSSTTAARKAITLTYNSSETEEISATVTIYTRYDHETLTVNAETLGKLSTTLEYIGSDSYSVNADNVAATSLFQVRDQNGDLVASPVITLSSSNTDAINTVSSNMALDFLCGGSARITASYAGDATYAAASNSGSFYRDITVNKLADAIEWTGLQEDGKIHVLADTTIAITMASSTHTSIASYASGSDTYMTVAGSAGAFTLTTLKVGEVTLTATSAGDCVYNAVSSTKTVVVDPCYHSIIWEQNFQGIQADENGHIDSTIVLNAYAVDSLGNRTSVGITYSIGSGSCAEMKDGKLHLKGVGDATIIATTATDDKYAVVSETKPISVVLWGVNKAMSANDDSDISDGKVVFDAPHARFTFGGETDITTFHYAKVQGKPEGYQLAMYLDKDDGTPKYYFTWESTNANCSIQVTKISFWAKAYTSNATLTNNGKLSFNGEDFVAIGTAALTANDGDFKHFDKPGTYTDSVWITCKSTWQNFDFYIKNIAIEYTVYTTAPSPTGGIANVNATINLASKQTIDLSSLFGYAVAAPSDFTYSYEIVESTTHADLVGGTAFWADSVGDYTVRAKVNADEDHRESGWSSTKTIRVNRVPYIFNNGAADQAWNTLGNWNASWLPTDEDTVIVRGDLVIDREIEVKKLSIESGVVEIAPNGGLTVGAGGVSGATTSNFVLKADSDPESATIGQTGYLRISPDYDGAMPNAKVELFSKAYYDPSVGGAVWQIVGAPIANAGIKAKTVYTKNWVYSWKESENDWYNNRSRMTFEPFIGFETTQDADADGLLMTYTGQLVAGNEVITKNLAFTDDDHGYNAIANSFAAPIAIDKFESTDFTNVDATIYILNSGTKEQSEANTGGYNAAGRFYNIPVANAATMATTYGTPLTIPSMQGFFLKAKASSAQVSFDYSRLVWDVDYTGSYVNQPLRAKKHTDDSQVGSLKVTLYADSGADHLFFLESDDYLPEFENGYDAHKMFDGGMAIYSINENDKMSVDATNSIIGTRVGVRTGEETAYTITFSYVDGEQEWALYDAETEEMIDITNDNTYTFFAEPNSNITERFMIVEREGAPAVTTGNDKVTSDVRAHKFIKDSQLFILKNGVLYDATGAHVK